MHGDSHRPRRISITIKGLAWLGKVVCCGSEIELFGKKYKSRRKVIYGDRFGSKRNFRVCWPAANPVDSVNLFRKGEFIEIQGAVSVGVLKTRPQCPVSIDVQIVGILQGHLGVAEGLRANLIGEDMQTNTTA